MVLTHQNQTIPPICQLSPNFQQKRHHCPFDSRILSYSCYKKYRQTPLSFSLNSLSTKFHIYSLVSKQYSQYQIFSSHVNIPLEDARFNIFRPNYSSCCNCRNKYTGVSILFQPRIETRRARVGRFPRRSARLEKTSLSQDVDIGGSGRRWKEGAAVSKLHVRAQRMRRPRWSWYPGAVPFLRGNWRTETSISYEENFRARINDVVCPHVRRTRVVPRTGTQQVRGKIWVVAFG